MTPLAQRIARELTLPRQKRTLVDGCGLLSGLMSDIHCFDVTEILPLVDDLLGKTGDRAAAGKRALAGGVSFLPAPNTWIEFQEDNTRAAYLIKQYDKQSVVVYMARDREFASDDRSLKIFLDGTLRFVRDKSHTEEYARSTAAAILVILALINSPRIIGRQQHMPHRGLERALLKQQKLIGKFPLHAWTEIKLEVTPPQEAFEDPSIEAHYTGKKALHFCRAHLRVVNGQLVFVRSHWRGDPALGMKQSRYTVVPPRAA